MSEPEQRSWRVPPGLLALAVTVDLMTIPGGRLTSGATEVCGGGGTCTSQEQLALGPGVPTGN